MFRRIFDSVALSLCQMLWKYSGRQKKMQEELTKEKSLHLAADGVIEKLVGALKETEEHRLGRVCMCVSLRREAFAVYAIYGEVK